MGLKRAWSQHPDKNQTREHHALVFKVFSKVENRKRRQNISVLLGPITEISMGGSAWAGTATTLLCRFRAIRENIPCGHISGRGQQ